MPEHTTSPTASSYDAGTGKLFYDADGSRHGGVATIHFATLSNEPTLDHDDFAIV